MGPIAQTAAAPEPEQDAFAQLASVLAGGMDRVDREIHARMSSSVGMIPDLAAHLIDAGGKRLRPLLTLAAAGLKGYDGDHAVKLAAAVEFIHTATLLHDDVVDGSKLRRGRKAANLVWGNSASILVGDFLFARAFNLMVETGSLKVLEILSNASSVIAEGEVRQLAAVNDPETSVDTYLSIIEAKTAELFAAAARAGGVAADCTPDEEDALDAFGRQLGVAFQLVDDALDYGGAEASLGKAVGDDFREGKVTLPVAIAMAEAEDIERAFWMRTIGDHDQNEGDFEHALALFRQHNALGQTVIAARERADHARQALAPFPDSALKEALVALTRFVVERTY
ncbi:MAG: polyprenyl synthetase family protein [Maricaulaceae bacterium]